MTLMLTTSLNMADDTKPLSGAAKVFSTFELIENMLLNICKSTSRDEEFSTFAQTVDVDSEDDDDPYYYGGMVVNPDPYPQNSLNWDHMEAHIEEIKALFRVQRANKTFRDVIARSKRLRVAMFKDLDCSDMPNIEKYTYHCPIRDADEERYTFEGYTPSLRLLGDAIQRYINPCIFWTDLLVSDSGFTWVDFRHARIWPNRHVEIDIYVRGSNLGELPKRASWRDMLLMSKPICGKMEFEGTYSSAYYAIELKHGYTLGNFVDEIDEFAKTEAQAERESMASLGLCRARGGSFELTLIASDIIHGSMSLFDEDLWP